MTHGACDAIRRRRIFTMPRGEIQVLEQLQFLPLSLVDLVLRRRVATAAIVFNGGTGSRMIGSFAPHTSLPIRIARSVCHNAGTPLENDRSIFPFRCLDVAVATCAMA